MSQTFNLMVNIKTQNLHEEMTKSVSVLIKKRLMKLCENLSHKKKSVFKGFVKVSVKVLNVFHHKRKNN